MLSHAATLSPPKLCLSEGGMFVPGLGPKTCNHHPEMDLISDAFLETLRSDEAACAMEQASGIGSLRLGWLSSLPFPRLNDFLFCPSHLECVGETCLATSI